MLEVKKITLENKTGEKRILENVDLVIGDNEIHCLLGKNGSGKTTLAHALMGINADLIKSGKIFLGNKDITKKKIFERAKLGLALAFQEPARFEGLMVEDFLALSMPRKDLKK